jgi:hypothetical protein
MSPWPAVTIITWIALLVLYLGLAATLRQVRLLSAELAALRARGDTRATGIDLVLPALAVPDGPATRLVVAADTGCPACHMTVGLLAELAPGMATSPLLLTYEPPEAWRESAGPMEIRQDTESWRALRHLAPPVLMSVDPSGRVLDLALPSVPQDVPRTVAAWGFRDLTRAGG